MQAKLISKTADDEYVIQVDRELLNLITPAYDRHAAGSPMPLHNYLPRAAEYSFALKQTKELISKCVNIWLMPEV